MDDISFSVRDGEIFGILRPNGAGKTTMVECVMGLRRPDAGVIRVLGRNPQADRAELRAMVGVQLQASALPLLAPDERDGDDRHPAGRHRPRAAARRHHY